MRTWMCLLVVLAVACGNKKDSSSKTGSGSGPVAQAGDAPAPAPVDGIEVFVDDVAVARVTKAQLASWPRLDTLVPAEARRLGTWMKLEFTATTPASLDKPSANHPDKVPVVFLAADGKPAFGMFDPVEHAKQGEPAYRADDVHAIRISLSKTERGGDHQGGTGEGADPTKLVVTVKTAAGDKQLTGVQILALPRESQPNNEDTKGWRLSQFLDAVGVKDFKSLVLIDSGGVTLPFEKAELDPKTTIPFIKLNKQGALRFRMFTKQGDGWQAGADLRALTTIQVR